MKIALIVTGSLIFGIIGAPYKWTPLLIGYASGILIGKSIML